MKPANPEGASVPQPLEPFHPTVLAVVGLVLIGAYAWLFTVLMDKTPFDIWGAAIVAPALIAVSIPVLLRQADLENDPRVFGLLLLAIVVKLLGAVVLYYVSFTVYGGVADASGYHIQGVALAQQLRHFDFSGVQFVIGTQFLRTVTGLVYFVIGPSKLGGFLFFSWLGFWGLFLFYKAFLLAVPRGRSRSYAHLVFFLPSLVFWPSSIGKDAWMMFGLGIGVYGVARILDGAIWRGLMVTLTSAFLISMVRPHIAALLGVALAASMVTRKTKQEFRELAPIVKGVSIIVIGALAIVLSVRAERFLQGAGIKTNDLTSALGDLNRNTAIDNSSFVASAVNSPLRFPMAALTVLFRPFIFEANNTQALLAAIEGTALMLFCFLRIRWFIAAIRSLRAQAYVVFCLVYSALFIVAFSSFANFGLLARERVQLYPIFLVLFSIPPTSVAPRAEERALAKSVAP